MVGVVAGRRRPAGRCAPRAILTAFSTASAPGGEERGALLVVAGCLPVERPATLDEAGVLGDHEAGVREPRRLLGDSARTPRGCGADAGHGNAGGEVDEVVAVDVHEQGTLGVVDEDRHG